MPVILFHIISPRTDILETNLIEKSRNSFLIHYVLFQWYNVKKNTKTSSILSTSTVAVRNCTVSKYIFQYKNHLKSSQKMSWIDRHPKPTFWGPHFRTSHFSQFNMSLHTPGWHVLLHCKWSNVRGIYPLTQQPQWKVCATLYIYICVLCIIVYA